jgi:hypothetical protein
LFRRITVPIGLIGLTVANFFEPLTEIPSLRCSGIQNIFNLLPFWLDRVGDCSSNGSQSWETYHRYARHVAPRKLAAAAHTKSQQSSLHHFHLSRSHSC